MNQKQYHTNACIGGPLDGQIYAHDGPSFRAPVLKPFEVAEFPFTDPDMPSATVELCTYSRMTFHTQGRDVTFWAADTETPFSALIRLINAYERRAKIVERATQILRDTDSDAPLTAGDFGKVGLMAQIDRLRAAIHRLLADIAIEKP